MDDVALKPMVLPPGSSRRRHLLERRCGTRRRPRAISTWGDVISERDLIAAQAVDGVAVGAVHELALPVAGSRIAGRTSPGDRVTVLTTLRHEDAVTTVVAAEDVMVLRWSGDGDASGEGVLTLALDDAVTAMSLAHLSRQGEVTVVRTTRAVDDPYPGRLSTVDLLATDIEAASMPGSDDIGARRSLR